MTSNPDTADGKNGSELVSGYVERLFVTEGMSEREEPVTMGILTDALKDKKTVVILGHVNPDGDCVGSCTGMYNYLTENFEDLQVSIYLHTTSKKFEYLKGYDQVITEYDPDQRFDLCITMDASDVKRLGDFAPYLETAKDSLCIDHHVTNTGMARVNVVEPEASSCCEVLYQLLDADKISKSVAESLYTGIIHDTGVFKYSSTSRKTLEIAGKLIEYGMDFSKIIDESFYMKSYEQTKLHGCALLNSKRIMDNRCIYTVVTQEQMKEFGCNVKAADGIVDELRVIDGAEVVILLYETGAPSEYKVSLRTNTNVDLSRIAGVFGGGGHVKAAGCTVTGTLDEILEGVCEQIRIQWQEMETV